MNLILETLEVKYKNLPFIEIEKNSRTLHLAAKLDQRQFSSPIILTESKMKKSFIRRLKQLSDILLREFEYGIDVKLFKLKMFLPDNIKYAEYFDLSSLIADYDVIFMCLCENANLLKEIRENATYQKIQAMFINQEKHNVIEAENIKKAGDLFVHRSHTKGFYLFNYFYREDSKLDFLPLWEHISRWFAEYTYLDNSYLLKSLYKKGRYQYINHCYWPDLRSFLPHILLRRSMKKFVLKNYALNRVLTFPLVYTIIDK